MCKFPARYFIAIFTFLIGVFVVSVWHHYQTSQQVQFTSVDFRPEPIPHFQENSSADWDSYFGTPRVWKFLLNDEYYGKLAVVRSDGETPDGQVKSMLRLDCPGKGTYPDASIDIIIGDMEKSGFNLEDYFLKSSSPVIRKNLVEVRAVSPNGELSFKTKADGNIGYENQYPTIIFFRLLKTKKLERLIAKGSTEVSFVIHDLEDSQKTITVTFPAIESSSQMVKDFRGCRK